MKMHYMSKGLFSVLILASSTVIADSKYPAADFQPEVVFQDKDYIAKTAQSAASTPAPVKAAAKAESAASTSEVDSKYPAADFKPQVIFHDPSYKHDSSVPVATSKQQPTRSASEEATLSSSEKQVDKNKSSGSDYTIPMIVVAVIGFFLFKTQCKAKSTDEQTRARAYTTVHPSGGMTGVARYVNKVSGTGVTRYLQKQAKAAAAAAPAVAKTGVSRYMEKNAALAKESSAEAATGVEKYLRGRG